MSTGSIIAVGEGDTWRGRYCHSDGYPTHQGHTLWTIVERDGLDQAVRTLVEDHAYWSFLHAERAEDHPDMDREWLAGYGAHSYNDVPLDEFAVPGGDTYGAEWLYVLSEGGMLVGSIDWQTDAITPVGFYRWVDGEPDWVKVECGENFERCGHCAWVHVDGMDRANRITMQAWLGRVPMDRHEISAVIVRGQRYPVHFGGSMRGPTMFNRDQVWYNDVTLPSGERSMIPLWKIGAKGTPVRIPGYRYVFPARRDSGEVVTGAPRCPALF